MPHVVSLTYTPPGVDPRPADRYARVPVERAVLVPNHGILGDVKGRRGRRQLNVMRAEVVEELRADGFRTAPGELGEEVVIAGLPAEALVAGARLRVGTDAVIELTYDRTPCGRFARIQGKDKDTARCRIGFLARVLVGGEVTVGSPVAVEPPEKDAEPACG